MEAVASGEERSKPRSLGIMDSTEKMDLDVQEKTVSRLSPNLLLIIDFQNTRTLQILIKS
jgi:hypothetical protein